MQQWFFVGSGDLADRLVIALFPSKWLHVLIVIYSIGVLWQCLRCLRRPEPSSIAPLLPHMATAPLLVALSLSFIALIADLSGASAVRLPPYTGMGAVWPLGLSRILHLVPTALLSYLVLLPMALWASHVYRRLVAEAVAGAA